MGRRGYPPELRRRALTLVASGRSVFQVATELGVSVPAIYAWRAQAQRDAQASGASTPDTPSAATLDEPQQERRSG